MNYMLEFGLMFYTVICMMYRLNLESYKSFARCQGKFTFSLVMLCEIYIGYKLKKVYLLCICDLLNQLIQTLSYFLKAYQFPVSTDFAVILRYS